MSFREPKPGVFTVDGVLPPGQCAALVDWAEQTGFDAAPVTTGMGFVHLPSVRNNTRVMFDNPTLAAKLWEELREHTPAELGPWRAHGLNERFRLYRYDPGQYFRRHSDGAFRRNASECSQITLMIYLNEGFEGGETSFDADCLVTPKTGMALGFIHRLRHAGETVTTGRKYVLRTDVMYRKAG